MCLIYLLLFLAVIAAAALFSVMVAVYYEQERRSHDYDREFWRSFLDDSVNDDDQ